MFASGFLSLGRYLCLHLLSFPIMQHFHNTEQQQQRESLARVNEYICVIKAREGGWGGIDDKLMAALSRDENVGSRIFRLLTPSSRCRHRFSCQVGIAR
jgi:hypothetical protein